MNITIVTCVYGRHDLTKIIFNYYRALADRSAHNIVLLACGSEEEKSAGLATSCGWNYVEHPNKPLSQKFNALFQAARHSSPDLVILVGSDDLVSEEVINWYAANIRPDHKSLVGLRDLYFYGIRDDQAVYFPGYQQIGYKNAPKSIGAGRCFSRYVLDAINWTPWLKDNLQRGLDSASSKNLQRRGIGEECIDLATTGGCAVDIKHPLVTLTRWGLVNDSARHTPTDVLNQFFPDEMTQIKALKKNSTFDEWETYEVQIIDRRHPRYGQRLTVSGKLAIDLAIRGIIETP